MSQPDIEKVLAYLDVLTNTADTTRQGLAGYHDYYEQVGYAATQIEMMGAGAVAGLVAALSSDRDAIRRHAIDLLARVGDARAIDPLKNLAGTDPDNAQRIERTLASIGDPALIATLWEKIDADNWHIRESAMGLAGEAGAIPIVLRGLSDVHEAVRTAAAKTINKHFYREEAVVAPLLYALQNDRSVLARIEIANALGRYDVQDARIAAVATQQLASEDDEGVLKALLGVMRNHPSSEAVPRIIQLLERAKLQQKAAAALRNISWKDQLDDEYIPMISAWMQHILAQEALTRQQPLTLNYASEAIAHSQTELAVDGLLALVRANLEKYSRKALNKLVRIEGEKSRAAQASLLQHEAEALRMGVLQHWLRTKPASLLAALRTHHTRPDIADAERARTQAVIERIVDDA